MIRDESVGDHDAIYNIHRQAFPAEEEALLVESLRAGGHVIASLVEEGDGVIRGHALFSRLSSPVPAVALGPVAVLPAYRRQGIAAALIRVGLQRCRDLGFTVALVVGDPNYYGRFGFSFELAEQIQSPYAVYGAAWMACALRPLDVPHGPFAVKYPTDWPAPE